MGNVRCLIANISQIVLADIVQKLAEEIDDIEVIDRISNIDDIESIVKKKSIDVLILGMKNNYLPKVCSDMLDKGSKLLVIGLVNDGRRLSVYIDNIGKNGLFKIIKIFSNLNKE